MINLLPALDETTKPSSVKNLRKAILGTRNMLDVFVYAYPNSTGSKKKDLWHTLRNELDSGYELIGTFQDLDHSNVSYSQQDVIRLRTPCIIWIKNFYKSAEKHNYRDYIRNPSCHTLYHRPSLAGFFWKLTSVVPSLLLSGPQNIGLLLRSLLAVARTTYDRVLTLQNITDPNNQHHFHAFRKLNRGIISLENDFGHKVFVPEKCENFAHAGDVVQEIYDEIGKLNDYYVSYEYYESNGELDKAETAKQQAEQKWEEIVAWMKIQNVPEMFECLSQCTV